LRGKSVLQLPPIIDRWERKTIPPMHAHEEEEQEQEAELFFQFPECSPPSLNCGRSKKGALEDDEEGKQSTEIARFARRDGKGRAKKTQSKTATYHLLHTFLPTRPTYLPIFLPSSILGILQASVERE
jgi:hypothetical protein